MKTGKKRYFVAEDRKLTDGSTMINFHLSERLFSRLQAKKALRRIKQCNPGAYATWGRAL